jgi:hypothetical protein
VNGAVINMEFTIKTRIGALELLVWVSDAQDGSMFLFHLKKAVKRCFHVWVNVKIKVAVTLFLWGVFSENYGEVMF